VRKIREVLRLKAQGVSDRQIAAAIGSARSTVPVRAPGRCRASAGAPNARPADLRLLGNDLAVLPKINRRPVHPSHLARCLAGSSQTATYAGCKTLRLFGLLTWSSHGPRSSNFRRVSELS
jgi:hypothetical protein